VGEVHHDDFGFGIQVFAGVGDVRKELIGLADVEFDDVTCSQHHCVNMDRERGGRHDCRISRSHQCQAHVAEPLFGADTGHDFRIRIEADTIFFPVAGRHFFSEVGNPVGDGIAVIPGVGKRF